MATRMELPVLPELRLQIAPPDVADVSATSALLGDPIRAGIIAILGSGPHCVCEMAAALGERQNNVSNHLAKLRRAGLVRASRHMVDARWVYYERDEAACAGAARIVPAPAAMTTLARPPAARPVLAGGRPGGRGVAHRVVHHPAARRLGRVRPARPAGGLAARRCHRLLPVRRAQGPAPADRDRHARLVPPFVRVAGTGPVRPRRPWRPARDHRGGRLRGRHPVLFLLGRAAVHRLRRGRASRSGSPSRSSSPRRWSTRSRSCCCGACSVPPSP